MAHGEFSTAFAEKKNWKVDQLLLQALRAVIPVGATVVDLGAGMGHYVAALRDLGYVATGFDGIEGIEKSSGGLVLRADLTLHQNLVLNYGFSWAISIEVGEHIPAEHSITFLDNLAAAATDGLIVSWAVPGQRGHNHVNCQPVEWVCGQLGARGWIINYPQTLVARQLAGKGWRDKLTVFQR